MKVEARIVRGCFAWCGNLQSESIHHYVRVPSGESTDALWLKFETPPEADWFSLRQSPDGGGCDYQHTVGRNQNTMFFSLKKIQDRSKPLYLCGFRASAEPFGRPIIVPNCVSEPIALDEPLYVRGDQEDCPVCLEPLPENRSILVCGHSFCTPCLLQCTDPLDCWSCKNNKIAFMEPSPAKHYFELRCPVCKSQSI